MTDTMEKEIYTVLLIVIVVIIAFVLLAKLAVFIDNFCYELKYIKMEIRRTNGSERQYWLREKKKLWLSLIPFRRK